MTRPRVAPLLVTGATGRVDRAVVGAAAFIAAGAPLPLGGFSTSSAIDS